MLLTSRSIDPDHVEKFLGVISQIEEVLPLDMTTIQERLFELKWPKKGKSLSLLATTVETDSRLQPLQAHVCLGSPPNHVSDKSPVLEFKLFDTILHFGEPYYPVSLSVFRSGRQILEAPGLVLDTTGKQTQFNKSQFSFLRRDLKGNQLALDVYQFLVRTFPTTTPREQRIQATALVLFGNPLKPDMG